jgi:hypothetical protein
LRTKEGQEVDFAIVHTQAGRTQVEQMIEVKTSDRTPHPGLRYFHQKYGYPAVQVVEHLSHEFQDQGIQFLKVSSFLASLRSF